MGGPDRNRDFGPPLFQERFLFLFLPDQPKSNLIEFRLMFRCAFSMVSDWHLSGRADFS